MFFKTNKLEVFKTPKNRTVNSKHVERLIQANRKNFLLDCYPIVVNENMEVFDGQHRLECARKLICEISYVVKEGLVVDSKNLLEINSHTRTHSIFDKIDIAIKYGHTEILKAEKLWRLNSAIPLHVCIQLLGSFNTGGQTMTQLANGTYKVLYEKEYKELIIYLSDLDIQNHIKYSGAFIFALCNFYKKFPHLIDSLKRNANKIQKAGHKALYLKQFIDACS